jgi:large subunit ribosomal protein L25
MSEIVLDAELRESTGKHAKYSRAKGMVPGVFYSRGEKNISIEVPSPALAPLIYTSETHIIDLRLKDGSSKKCILRDVQFDPVSDKPVHFDLQGLKENEKLTIEVPIVLTGGTPKGVKDGGMVQQMIHKLRVSCLPKDIPEKIEINIADLEINRSVHVRELQLPNVSILENLDNPIVGVMPPTLVKEAEAAPVVEEAAAEPEVIGKGKKPEEGEEGAEAAPKAEAKGAPKADAKPAPKEEKKEKK